MQFSYAEERRRNQVGRVLGFLVYVVAKIVCWNAAIVTFAVIGCILTSGYVNIYFYYLGMGHWLGFVYALAIGYRCYSTMQLINITGLVLCYVCCWIIVELKRIR